MIVSLASARVARYVQSPLSDSLFRAGRDFFANGYRASRPSRLGLMDGGLKSGIGERLKTPETVSWAMGAAAAGAGLAGAISACY